MLPDFSWSVDHQFLWCLVTPDNGDTALHMIATFSFTRHHHGEHTYSYGRHNYLNSVWLFLAGDDYSARFLLEHGASVSLATPDNGDTALHMIATCSPDTTMEDTLTAMVDIANLLLDRGLDPNLQNNKGL